MLFVVTWFRWFLCNFIVFNSTSLSVSTYDGSLTAIIANRLRAGFLQCVLCISSSFIHFLDPPAKSNQFRIRGDKEFCSYFRDLTKHSCSCVYLFWGRDNPHLNPVLIFRNHSNRLCFQVCVDMCAPSMALRKIYINSHSTGLSVSPVTPGDSPRQPASAHREGLLRPSDLKFHIWHDWSQVNVWNTQYTNFIGLSLSVSG